MPERSMSPLDHLLDSVSVSPGLAASPLCPHGALLSAILASALSECLYETGSIQGLLTGTDVYMEPGYFSRTDQSSGQLKTEHRPFLGPLGPLPTRVFKLVLPTNHTIHKHCANCGPTAHDLWSLLWGTRPDLLQGAHTNEPSGKGRAAGSGRSQQIRHRPTMAPKGVRA